MEKELKTVENTLKTLICECGTDGAIDHLERLFEVYLEYNDYQDHQDKTADFFRLKNQLQDLLRTAKREYNIGL